MYLCLLQQAATTLLSVTKAIVISSRKMQPCSHVNLAMLTYLMPGNQHVICYSSCTCTLAKTITPASSFRRHSMKIKQTVQNVLIMMSIMGEDR